MILLYSSMVWLAVCVDGAESLIPVSAAVGSTAVLPCKLTKEFTNKSVIKWYIGNKLVLERSINNMSEGPGFEGRVDVPVDELRKGNCSLVLKDVRISDDGLYKTFSMEFAEETINSVHLSVAASGWILDSSEEKTNSSSEHWDPQPVGNGTSWIIWTSVISVLIIIIIIISVFVIYRRSKDKSC